jgi:hypothetical protein
VLRLRARQQDRPGMVTFLLKGFLADAVPAARDDPEHLFLLPPALPDLVQAMAKKRAPTRPRAAGWINCRRNEGENSVIDNRP